MEGRCSTGQSPQWSVVAMEEEEEEEEEEEGGGKEEGAGEEEEEEVIFFVMFRPADFVHSMCPSYRLTPILT